MTSRSKKVLLSIGITVGVLLLLAASAGLLYYNRLTEARSNFRSLESKEVYPGVYVLKSGWFINAWVFKTDCGLVAFDTGLKPVDVQRAMAKLHLDPKEVNTVILTHTDKEHVGGVGAYPNAEVYMAKEEVQMVDGTRYRATILYPKNRISIPINKINVLENGQDLEVCGLKIHCVLVPGHTPGSMAYVLGDKLITGDTINIIDGHAEIFNPFPLINMNQDRMGASVSRMAQLTGIKHVLTTHFGISDDFKKLFANW